MMSRKLSGFIRCKQIANAAAFQLENALRLAAAEQGESFRVVQGKLVRIDALAGGLLDQIDDLRENCEISQAEEIHFQQAGAFHVAHRPLGDDFLLVLHALQGDVFGQRAVGDHHGGGVRADVARQPLDLPGQVQSSRTSGSVS